MGKGRPRKPIATIKLEGKFQPSLHADRIDDVIAAEIAPLTRPDDLDEAGRRCWSLIVECQPAGVYTQADLPLFRLACRWWSIWEAAEEACDLKTMAEATKQYLAIVTRLGLSPVDRAKLSPISRPKPQQMGGVQPRRRA